jgi:chaperonin GroES
MSVSVGDRVLLPQWGENKVTIDEKEYYLFRETELLGLFGK